MEEESGKGGEHLSDVLDPELRDGGLIFERYTSKSDCSLTGWHKAGRGIVPWSELFFLCRKDKGAVFPLGTTVGASPW